MFKKLQKRKDIALLVEEKFYEYVANEIEAGDIRAGLWAKASAQAASSGEADIKRKYVELRVEHLQAEKRLAQQFLEEIEAASAGEVTSRAKTVPSQSGAETARRAAAEAEIFDRKDMEGFWGTLLPWYIAAGIGLVLIFLLR